MLEQLYTYILEKQAQNKPLLYSIVPMIVTFTIMYFIGLPVIAVDY